MSNCPSCSYSVDSAWIACPSYGLPLQTNKEEEGQPEIVIRKSLVTINQLTSANAIFRELRPETFGSTLLQELLVAGNYATAETDFNFFGEDRPPLRVTVVIETPERIQEVFDEFMDVCQESLFGFVEAPNDVIVFVTGAPERSECLPNGLDEISAALGGTKTVLLECMDTAPPPLESGDCFYSESDQLCKVVSQLGLVTGVFDPPVKYELKAGVESTVFKFLPQESNPDSFIRGCIYMGSCSEKGEDLKLKGMYNFDEMDLRAILRSENWAIELSGKGVSTSEFRDYANRLAIGLESTLDYV